MAIKEAFDIIVSYVPICFKEELETIEKYLKVLETLKRNLCFYGCCIDFYRDENENINTKMDTNDYQIVKEWLENDK